MRCRFTHLFLLLLFILLAVFGCFITSIIATFFSFFLNKKWNVTLKIWIDRSDYETVKINVRISCCEKEPKKCQRKMTKLFMNFFEWCDDFDTISSYLVDFVFYFFSWNGLDSVKQQKQQQFQYFSISRKFNFAIANFWCMLRHTDWNISVKI